MAILDTDLDERVIAQNALTSATERLKSLTSSHAPTFVAVECRENQLKSSLSTLLSKLVENEPKVETVKDSLVLKKKEKFETNAASSLATLADRHRLRRRTLLQHSALLELLELPSLMDACVRSNDLYDEALSIAAFANTLERRHLSNSGNGGVVENVIAEIRRRELDLKRQLLSRLRGDVTMPQCLEVVTSLRRLNGVELERTGTNQQSTADDLESVHAAMELRLQVDFFEARDVWLDSYASSLSNFTDMKIVGYSELLLENIERYRTRCFEIATQFLAIFRTSSSSSNSVKTDADLSLLSLWTTRRVQIFLTTLTKQIARIDDCALLRDAIDATLFFATSMGRIGADFQSLLPPIFEPQLVNIIFKHWKSGAEGLENTLKVCREAGVASPLFANITAENLKMPKEEEHHNDDDIPSSSSTPLPPRRLLALPPLGRFLNSYLTGLNELRRCLLPGAFSALRQCFDDVFDEVENVLETNFKLVHTPGLKGEAAKLREVSKDLQTEFEGCLLPYCRNSLDIAFGFVREVENFNEEEEQGEDEESIEEEKSIESEGDSVYEGATDEELEDNERENVHDEEQVLQESSEEGANDDDVTEDINEKEANLDIDESQ